MATRWQQPRKSGLTQRCCDIVEIVVEEVCIGVERHRGRGMSQHPLYRFHVRAGADRETRCGVSEVVRRDPRERWVCGSPPVHCAGEPSALGVGELHPGLSIAEHQRIGVLHRARRRDPAVQKVEIRHLPSLPESFDFALRGRFVGAPVFLGDALKSEQRLERVQAGLPATPRESARVYHAVIGERRGRIPARFRSAREGAGHDSAGHSRVNAEVGEVSGVIIEPGDDLDLGSAAELPVGEG